MSESSSDEIVMVDYLDDEGAIMSDDNNAAADPPDLADETEIMMGKSSKVVVNDNDNDNKNNDSRTVDKNNNDNKPMAHQIVSIGTEEDAYAFHFDEEKMNEILKRIPMGWEVAVVCVVGAFRTGKSFLLSWFLRYLHCLENGGTTAVLSADTTETNAAVTAAQKKSNNKPWYEQFPSLGNDGFDWKAGSERNTTGVWMWSQPHFIQRNNNQKPLAVLLVDTQGMFDHETTMSLTASIFGFSTLLSSCQIYNVDKRIQEDNLQQLALFSEYARSAMGTEEKEEKQKKMEQALSLNKSIAKEEEKVSEKVTSSNDEEDDSTKTEPASSSTTKVEVEDARRPFQHIEFLVRDWQHFEDEDEDDFEAMETSLTAYLAKVIAEREATDLKETREQILSCFDKITCYGLCHPGFSVTKKKYSGEVNGIEPLFLRLLDRYCKRIFDPNTLQAKMIHGRSLTAVELGSYVRAYAALFASGAKFPTAATLLEATASANNTNAIQLAMAEYKEQMDRIAGPRCNNFIKQDVFDEEHRRVLAKSLQVFESIATFGSSRSIEMARSELQHKVDESLETYESLNKSRNPLLGLETYLIPALVGIVAYLLRILTDFTCSPYSQVCRVGSDFLAHTHAAIWCFLAILVTTKFKEIKDVVDRIMVAVEVIMQPPAAAKSGKKQA